MALFTNRQPELCVNTLTLQLGKQELPFDAKFNPEALLTMSSVIFLVLRCQP